MQTRFKQRLQIRLLSFINGMVCRHFRRKHLAHGTLPSYIVVTPQLVHLAPLAALNPGPGVSPVFVANGISREDQLWLNRHSPGIPILRLATSLSGNRNSLIEHGKIIDYLARANPDLFCIQDADCFITDKSFWHSLELDPLRHFATGPFVRQPTDSAEAFPETFFLCLNSQLIRKYQRKYHLSATCSDAPNRKIQTALTGAGYPPNTRLETLKNYYDTLQQYWVIAKSDGFVFARLPGEDQIVYHIGGTSYLFNQFDDVAHWDYWPLAVHYLHLRLLEMPACEPLRDRFSVLFDHYGTSDNLLAQMPGFASGWRRRNADTILSKLDATARFATEIS